MNGLDPEGVRWVREFVRHIAAEGRTVLLSSHLMSEMALTADHVIVLGRGQVLADAPIADLVRSWTSETVLVRSPELSRLVEVLRPEGASATAVEPGAVSVTGASATDIGDLAARYGIPLHELTPRRGSLEDAYLALTDDAVEYKTKELA